MLFCRLNHWFQFFDFFDAYNLCSIFLFQPHKMWNGWESHLRTKLSFTSSSKKETAKLFYFLFLPAFIVSSSSATEMQLRRAHLLQVLVLILGHLSLFTAIVSFTYAPFLRKGQGGRFLTHREHSVLAKSIIGRHNASFVVTTMCCKSLILTGEFHCQCKRPPHHHFLR